MSASCIECVCQPLVHRDDGGVKSGDTSRYQRAELKSFTVEPPTCTDPWLPTVDHRRNIVDVVSLQPGQTLAHYEILEPIGKGGIEFLIHVKPLWKETRGRLLKM